MSSSSSDRNLFATDHLMSDLKGRSLRGGAVTLISQITKFIIQLISTIVLARLLTPEDYGIVAMVTAITGFMKLFKDAGLSLATVQRDNITREQISTLFWFNILVSIVLMLVTFSIAPAISFFYDQPRLVKITFAYGVTFLLSGFTIQHEALLRRQMRFNIVAAINIIAMLLSIVVSISVAYYFQSYWAIVLLQVTHDLVLMLGVWFTLRWIPDRPRWDRNAWELIKFGGDVSLSNAIAYFAVNGDKFLIGWKHGSNELGYYSRAYTLLLMPVEQIIYPITSVVIPMLSRLQNDPVEYKKTFIRILGTIVFVLSPVTAILFVASKPLIYLFLGPKWDPVAQIFAVFSLSVLYLPMSSIVNWLLITQGRTKTLLKVTVINSIIAIISFIVGLPYGAIGVAASFTIAGILLRFPLQVYYAGQKGPVNVKAIYNEVISNVIICMVVAVICRLAYQNIAEFNPFLQLVLCSLVGAGAFLIISLIMPSTRKRLVDLHDMFQRFVILPTKAYLRH